MYSLRTARVPIRTPASRSAVRSDDGHGSLPSVRVHSGSGVEVRTDPDIMAARPHDNNNVANYYPRCTMLTSRPVRRGSGHRTALVGCFPALNS